ncbi:uncharacterized protein LOC141637285 [Silene latifolia]|uniref:uncharacterized protein LOC141637285 n=1 Tax=Silene latifolia TaxID=37657 RepID=UPI003D7761FD
MLGTKKLSYAGRLVLVKAVFKSLHTYWASIFILPKGVIAKIEAICRNFLWSGGSEYAKTPTVAWSKICKGKKQGGLGLKNECLWNKVAVGKPLWWIHAHPDKLWVQWIHSTYIRGKEYSVGKGYSWLQQPSPDVVWYHQIWNKWTVPKHGMIAWLYQHQGLNTKDKLFRLNISSDFLCCICGNEEETPEHLFFKCKYSKEILTLIQTWTGIDLPDSRDYDWRRNARFYRLKVEILHSIMNAVTYHVWRQRNGCRYEMQLQRPEVCVAMIQYEIRTKVQQQIKGNLAWRDLECIEKLM